MHAGRAISYPSATHRADLLFLHPQPSSDFVLYYIHSVLRHTCLLCVVWEFTRDLKQQHKVIHRISDLCVSALTDPESSLLLIKATDYFGRTMGCSVSELANTIIFL